MNMISNIDTCLGNNLQALNEGIKYSIHAVLLLLEGRLGS